MSALGKRQKKPSEQSLQERQFSTSSIPYGECIARFLYQGAQVGAESLAVDRGTSIRSVVADRQGSCPELWGHYVAQRVQVCAILLN